MIEFSNDSFENLIAEETEHKEPIFEKEEITEKVESATKNNDEPKHTVKEVKTPLDADFTTEFAVDSLDAIQHTIFFALNNRKWKNRYFDNKAEFNIATKLAIMTPEQIETLENPEAQKILKKRYDAFREKMNQIDKDLELEQRQKERLMNPIKKMVIKAGYDLPPSLALVIISGQILSERMIDLMMD